MTDILLNYDHITHQMKIICAFKVFSASCIRLFDRLSDLSVLNYLPFSRVQEIGGSSNSGLQVLCACDSVLAVLVTNGARGARCARCDRARGARIMSASRDPHAPGRARDLRAHAHSPCSWSPCSCTQ